MLDISHIEIETAPTPSIAVIWLHGLGADGSDFVPMVEELGLAEIAFFDLGSLVFGLFQRDALAEDANVSPEGSGFPCSRTHPSVFRGPSLQRNAQFLCV